MTRKKKQAPPKMPEEGEEENGEEEAESRLDALEKNVEGLTGSVQKILTILESKSAAEEDPETEPGRQPQEEGDTEDEEKKKEVPPHAVDPNPEGGDVKLPKASAGETDEDDKPEGNKGEELVEKQRFNKAVQKKVSEVLKGMGLQKSTTPRSKHTQDVDKATKPAEGTDKAMDIIKRFKKGEISKAQMNQEIKSDAQSNYQQKVQKILNSGGV